MYRIDTTYLAKCNQALKRAYSSLQNVSDETIEYEIYRSAVVKEFEILLEQSGKLLKKVLRAYFSSNKEVDKLTFKDIFRYAGVHSLLEIDEVERWFQYRDLRNSTAHDYGENFAEEILEVVESFSKDVDKIIKVCDDFEG
ncbi:nucleotidyltransferase substrate binding protein [Sulfurimonas sp.]